MDARIKSAHDGRRLKVCRNDHENRHLEHQRRQGAPRQARPGSQRRRPTSPACRRSSASTRPFPRADSRSSATMSPSTARRLQRRRHPLEAAVRRGDAAACPAIDDDEQARYHRRRWSRANGRAARRQSIYLPNGNPIRTEKFAYKLAWMARLRIAHRSRCSSAKSRWSWPATTTSSPSRSTP